MIRPLIPEIAQRAIDNYNNYKLKHPLEFQLFRDDNNIHTTINAVYAKMHQNYLVLYSDVHGCGYSIFSLWSPYDAQVQQYGITVYCEVWGKRWIYNNRIDKFVEINASLSMIGYDILCEMLKITKPQHNTFKLFK